jgi:hypothetical protein
MINPMINLTPRNVIGWFLALHGLAHAVLGAAARPDAPGSAPWSVFTTHSWALTGAPDETVRLVGLVLWIAAAAGFILAGLGVLTRRGPAGPAKFSGAGGRRGLALGSALVSAALLVLFWHPLLGPGLVIDALVIGGATIEWKRVKEIVQS